MKRKISKGPRHDFSKLEGLKPPMDLEAADLRVLERLEADLARDRAKKAGKAADKS